MPHLEYTLRLSIHIKNTKQTNKKNSTTETAITTKTTRKSAQRIN